MAFILQIMLKNLKVGQRGVYWCGGVCTGVVLVIVAPSSQHELAAATFALAPPAACTGRLLPHPTPACPTCRCLQINVGEGSIFPAWHKDALVYFNNGGQCSLPGSPVVACQLQVS